MRMRERVLLEICNEMFINVTGKISHNEIVYTRCKQLETKGKEFWPSRPHLWNCAVCEGYLSEQPAEVHFRSNLEFARNFVRLSVSGISESDILWIVPLMILKRSRHFNYPVNWKLNTHTLMLSSKCNHLYSLFFFRTCFGPNWAIIRFLTLLKLLYSAEYQLLASHGLKCFSYQITLWFIL
jgi:hypothetical protein